jgi:hypothetical protein
MSGSATTWIIAPRTTGANGRRRIETNDSAADASNQSHNAAAAIAIKPIEHKLANVWSGPTDTYKRQCVSSGCVSCENMRQQAHLFSVQGIGDKHGSHSQPQEHANNQRGVGE